MQIQRTPLAGGRLGGVRSLLDGGIRTPLEKLNLGRKEMPMSNLTNMSKISHKLSEDEQKVHGVDEDNKVEFDKSAKQRGKPRKDSINTERGNLWQYFSTEAKRKQGNQASVEVDNIANFAVEPDVRTE